MSSNRQKLTAVIFDFDDTLIDWSGQTMDNAELNRLHMGNVYLYLQEREFKLPTQKQFLKLFRENLIGCWTNAKKSWAGVSFASVLTETFLALELDISQINIDHVMHAYDWKPVPGVVPFADTLSVLQTLKEQGFKIGLISNSMQPMWMRDIELDAHGILPFLDARVTSGDVGFMKPHPAIYHYLLTELGVTAETAVFVGDRPANDIAGANKVGMISVLMNPPHLNYDLDGVVPDYTITQLSELLPILGIQ